MIDEQVLTRIALMQLLAQLDCGLGRPLDVMSNSEIRTMLGANTTETQDEAIEALRAMLQKG